MTTVEKLAKDMKYIIQTVDELSIVVDAMNDRLKQHKNCLKLLLSNHKCDKIEDYPSKL